MPKKTLVIVESPAKARTIGRFLGGDFDVTSSMGHIRDLPKSKIGVDVENNFEPVYETPENAKKIVAELRKKAQGAAEVILATDEDREGIDESRIRFFLSELRKLYLSFSALPPTPRHRQAFPREPPSTNHR